MNIMLNKYSKLSMYINNMERSCSLTHTLGSIEDIIIRMGKMEHDRNDNKLSISWSRFKITW